AYVGLLPQHVLDMLPQGWVTLHSPLLPAYRGAAPVQWAMINQETETGAAVFQLESGLDSGPVFSTVSRPLAADETAGEVLADLAETGAELLATTLSDLAAGSAGPTPPPGQATWAPKPTRHPAKTEPPPPAGARPRP